MRIVRLIPVAAVILQKGISYIMILALSRILSAESFGEYYFLITAATGLFVFVTESMAVSSLKILSDFKRDLPEDISKTYLKCCPSLFFAASIVSGTATVTYLASFYGDKVHDSKILISMFLISSCFSFNIGIYAVFMAVGRWLVSSVIQIIYSALALCAVIYVAIHFGYTEVLQTVAVCTLLASIVYLVAFWIDYGSPLFFKSGQFLDLFKRLGKRAMPIAFSLLLGSPIHFFCMSLLESESTLELGIFGKLFLAYTAISFLPLSLNNLVIPWINSGSELENDRKRVLFRTYFAYAVFIGGLVAFLSPLLLRYFSLDDSYKFHLLLIAFSGALAIFSTYFYQLLYARGDSRNVLLGTLVYGGSYILASILLIKFCSLGSLGLILAIVTAAFIQLTFLRLWLGRTI